MVPFFSAARTIGVNHAGKSMGNSDTISDNFVPAAAKSAARRQSRQKRRFNLKLRDAKRKASSSGA